jgi:hypothetical protein
MGNRAAGYSARGDGRSVRLPERSPKRFYSMSAQIQSERNDYYEILERTQKGTLEVTPWMQWFLGCLDRAFVGAEVTLASVLRKARFWEVQAGESFNGREGCTRRKAAIFAIFVQCSKASSPNATFERVLAVASARSF